MLYFYKKGGDIFLSYCIKIPSKKSSLSFEEMLVETLHVLPNDFCMKINKFNSEIVYFIIQKSHSKNNLCSDTIQNFFVWCLIVFILSTKYLLHNFRNLWGYIFCSIDIKKNLNISISTSH